MPLSVRLDPGLELRLEEEARRQGKTKSAIVTETLKEKLEYVNPYELLLRIRSNTPTGDPHLSENTGEKVKKKLREKYYGKRAS